MHAALPLSVLIVIATSMCRMLRYNMRYIITNLFVTQPHFWLGLCSVYRRESRTWLSMLTKSVLSVIPLIGPSVSSPFPPPLLPPSLPPSLAPIQQQDALDRKERREKRSKQSKLKQQWLEAEVEYRTAKVHGRLI